MGLIDEGYEINIGLNGNTASSIGVIGGMSNTFASPRLLECNKPKLFWVAWKDGTIAVGSGVGSTPFMMWAPPVNISISAVSMANSGNRPALWYMDPRIGMN